MNPFYSQLLSPKDCETLPELYSQENEGQQARAFVRWYCVDNGWTWYALEASAVLDDEDGTKIPLRNVTDWSAVVDVLFFGLVHGFESELGYFALSEFQRANQTRCRPFIIRDGRFKPRLLSKCERMEFVRW